MSSIVYETVVETVGKSVAEMAQENIVIFFRKGAPEYLAEFCYLIGDGSGSYDIHVGDELLLGQVCCPVTAIGDVALENFKNLGHLTVRFDGAADAQLPGTMHVKYDGIPPIEAGMKVVFQRNS